MARLTWVRAVAGLTTSRAAISSLRQALADQADDLPLPLGQRVQLRVRLEHPRRPGRELAHHPPGHRRRQQRLARRHQPDGPQQLGRLGVLGEEAARAVPQRVEDVLVQLERGQHDHPGAAPAPGRRRSAGSPRCRRCRASVRPSARCPAAPRATAATAASPSAASPTSAMSVLVVDRARAGRSGPGPGRRRARPGSRRGARQRQRQRRGDPEAARPGAGRPTACRPARSPAARIPAMPGPGPSSSTDAAAPGVGHLDLDRVRPVATRTAAVAATGVPQHVGQRLLHDPVGGQVDRGRQVPRGAPSMVTVTGSPASASRSRSAGSWASPGAGARSSAAAHARRAWPAARRARPCWSG